MFNFPKNLYTDVRIEEVFESKISYLNGSIEENKVRNYTGAFIRIYDGENWYYCSTSDTDNIQKEIEKLSLMAKPSEKIYDNEIVKKLQVNEGEYLIFEKDSVRNISKEEKENILKDLFPVVASKKEVKMWKAQYLETLKIKNFYSSKGSNIKHDYQSVAVALSFSLADGEKKFDGNFQKASNFFKDIVNEKENLEKRLDECIYFMRNATEISPGEYTVVLSPLAAGVFAHESFGHKSEADFMVGDETMKREWAIGTKVGSEILSIIDSGNIMGSGYVPYDDEGTKASRTYLIEKGILKGRLHSGYTAASLEEAVTGNARAMNFEYESIVRMTTTYIEPGKYSKEELISEVQEGLLVETINHGSGMSTFTLAPSLAYKIKDGKISEPVKISVITGTVFDTLNNIDGLSNELEILAFATGGCGKMEQWPLNVGFGGPYVRVKNMNVQ